MNEPKRNRKYLTIDMWESWLKNHWKHMTWKVNGMLAGMIIMIGLIVAILCAMLSLVYGG